MTRVGEILERHLALAERQLEFAFEGVDFSAKFDGGAKFIALTEGQLRNRVAGLASALKNHRERS